MADRGLSSSDIASPSFDAAVSCGTFQQFVRSYMIEHDNATWYHFESQNKNVTV